MFQPKRWPAEALLPIVAGFVWLKYAHSFGILELLLAVLPGCLLLSSGFAALLYPGDGRIPQFIAMGGLLGIILGIPVLFLASPLLGLALMVLSAAAFICAGAVSLTQEPHVKDVPEPERSVRLAAEIAVDDAVLGVLGFMVPIMVGRDPANIRREVHEARVLFQGHGWLANPAAYHQTPPALEQHWMKLRRSSRLRFEHLSFESFYEPHPGEPGRKRWLSNASNDTAHAWLLRHPGPPRPWLVCIHGYTMGSPGLNFSAFQAAHLHQQLGLNLAFPILPYHGPRKAGRWHGKGFISGDFMDLIHAEAQAVWDLRRIIAWLRTQGELPVGVYGLSLGGYNAALLASLDAQLACAIAGVPATGLVELKWRHGPVLYIRYAEHHGLVHDEVSEVMRVVSPLALSPVVPKERRYLFGAVGDQLAPVEQIRNLWRHWDHPSVLYYQGAHCTFRFHPAVTAFIDKALRESGLVS